MLETGKGSSMFFLEGIRSNLNLGNSGVFLATSQQPIRPRQELNKEPYLQVHIGHVRDGL